MATSPKTIYLKDYAPPAYLIESVNLRFELHEEATVVHSRLELVRNPLPGQTDSCPLVLDGQQLELLELRLNGEPLGLDRYVVDEDHLTITGVPDAFSLEVATRIHPESNTALEGLYKSSGNYCTQCEAEGFRKISYYLDRPDVMARFKTTIVADASLYPVLLSNGNPVGQGKLDDGRHWVTWEDPFRKPCYLFALVAGNLVHIEDSFTTRSGRRVALRLYTEPHNIDQCDHAMRSLKKAMRWDEERFGLEYDLNIYMIVAVGDFNMGAMENKGLNIFNTKYVLAKPETATDSDYLGIEAVIGHEYFHNWTGNRVTCRDWFQLSLKEGLTVFRDQEFSSDMNSRAVKRIGDVRLLRSTQFSQDAGPMAHPVRPESYIEINNFYTVTVYNKGAEVVRMIYQLLGEQGFRRGMDRYISRHDGQAVTTDDFVAAMEGANGIDLGQFRRWYSQSGTPELTVSGAYDASVGSYTLKVSQTCPPTPGQPVKEPFHIPFAIGLLDRQGKDLPLQLDGELAPSGTQRVLELREAEHSFRFVTIPEPPLPSLLRGFTAPVKLSFGYSDEDLTFLLAHDSDEFNRWEAGQQLAVRLILRLIEDRRAGKVLLMPAGFGNALRGVLEDPELEPALVDQILNLPDESYLAEQMAVVDVDDIHLAREFLRRALAESLRDRFLVIYQRHHSPTSYQIDPIAIGRRSLKNRCLDYLMQAQDPLARQLCLHQFDNAGNMTDQLSALGILAHCDCPERTEAIDRFYRRWRHEPLVVDKWFYLQATSPLPDTLDEVKQLLQHPAFSIKNPNKVRSLIGAFCKANPFRFHASDGAGYAFLREQIMTLDPINPQMAAQLLGAFTRWRNYDQDRGAKIQAELEGILQSPSLSADVYEVASKSLER